MRIGVLKEIKNHEYRVGMTPQSVFCCVAEGHEVVVQSGAGAGIGLDDAAYENAGAALARTAQEVFDRAELIIKVKEPQPQEVAMLKSHHVLFTYLHLAPDRQQTLGLVNSGATCIAYETVTSTRVRGLPLLRPMSQVAGRLSVQAGAHVLEKSAGGRGVLLSGVPGVRAGKVCIIGGGVVGEHAARIALGMGAETTLLDLDVVRLESLSVSYGSGLRTLVSNREHLEACAQESDLLIGAVLVPGAATPKIIDRKLLELMQPGSVFVDVSIDQGGCAETSRATTYDDPTYVEEDVIHYCVANMPGAVPYTSTFALNAVTLPFIMQLAAHGWKEALRKDSGFAEGLNVHAGHITCEPVARAQNLPYVPIADVLN